MQHDVIDIPQASTLLSALIGAKENNRLYCVAAKSRPLS